MINPIDFARFLEIVLPDGGYVLTMIEAYFDESGAHQSAPLLCVGGYLFETEKARIFDAEWRKMLDDFKVPFFHMSACEARKPPFEHLNSELREALTKRAIKIIGETFAYGVVVAVSEDEYERIVPDHPLIGRAYSFLAYQMFTAVKRWADEENYQGRISYFFEGGAAHQENTNAIMTKAVVGENIRNDFRYSSHAFLGKKDAPALQAADLLVWHYCDDWNRQQSGNYSRDRYVELINDQYWHMLWNGTALENIAESIKTLADRFPDAGRDIPIPEELLD